MNRSTTGTGTGKLSAARYRSVVAYERVVFADCSSWYRARPGLCGGRPVTGVPTAILLATPQVRSQRSAQRGQNTAISASVSTRRPGVSCRPGRCTPSNVEKRSDLAARHVAQPTEAAVSPSGQPVSLRARDLPALLVRAKWLILVGSRHHQVRSRVASVR
jgi:hypothetical protein